MTSAATGRRLAALALTFNAFTWGVSWWPLRQLEALGLHPLWSTVFVYLLAVGAITATRAAAWRELATTPSLWWLVLAAGTTNAAFNWGVTLGDVVRVVLLFYLMPLWAALLAWLVLGERLTERALLRVAMAACGAVIVLWPEAAGSSPAVAAAAGSQAFAGKAPLAALGLLSLGAPELLGLVGGFTFALNNVLLRREAARSDAARALAMFGGGTLVAGLLAVTLAAGGWIAGPPAPSPAWLAGVMALGAAFLLGNLALQYGATRLPANVTAVIMISEVLFASSSAALLGAAQFSAGLVLGGALIVGAALLAVRD